MPDVRTLLRFGESLVGVLTSSCVGMILGGLIALTVVKSVRTRKCMINIIGVWVWFPFLFFWALPFDYVSMVVPASLAATPFVADEFLVVQPFSSWLTFPVLSMVGYRTILQSLLFYIVLDLWFPKGWLSLSLGNFTTDCFLIVIAFIFLVSLHCAFRIRFSATADQRARALVNKFRGDGDYGYTVLMVVACFFVWAAIPEEALDIFHIPTIKVVLRSFPVVFASDNLLAQTILSTFEIVAGMVLTGAVAAVLMQRRNISNARTFGWVGFTAIIPILLAVPVVYWAGFDVAIWGTILDVAFLTFYPYVEAYWGLRNHPQSWRISLAVNNAFPYGFIGMVFGEMISSSQGLVFQIIVNRNTLVYENSFGIALWLFFIFLLISYLLRIVAEREMKSETGISQ